MWLKTIWPGLFNIRQCLRISEFFILIMVIYALITTLVLWKKDDTNDELIQKQIKAQRKLDKLLEEINKLNNRLKDIRTMYNKFIIYY